MRASKLITISTVAVLMGGTSFAIGQGSSQSAEQQSAEQRGSTTLGTQELKGGRAITTERGRVITGPRGQAMTAERGQAVTEQGRKTALHKRPTIGQPTGPAFARGTAREAEIALNTEQRMRLRDIMASRPDIPRVSRPGAEVRVNAFVPKTVPMAAVPQQVVRLYPQFRRDRVFVSRDQIVIVNPATSRIVAVLPA